MRFNNTFKITDTPQVILPVNINKDSITVYHYDVVNDPVKVPFKIETKNSFNFISPETLVNDSFFIIVYEGGFEVIRIGAPPIVFFTYLKSENQETIPYIQYDYEGEIIKTGYLELIAQDVYAVLITNIVKSFIQVIGSLTTLTLPAKYANLTTSISGTITLQRGCWQNIAIPEKGKVKEIFLDRLAKQEGVDITELVEFVSAYPGSVNRFLTFKPGFTLDTSEHNFDLISKDGESNEINGFWVKCKAWTHKTTDIVYSWSNTESEGV